MPTTKRIFLSDIHMGLGWTPEPGSGQFTYDWLPKKEAEKFAEFLVQIAADQSLDEVVFVGDLMDNWVCPVDFAPPSFEQILTAPHNIPITNAIRGLVSAGKSVVYLPGNHDMTVSAQTVGKLLNGVKFAAPGVRNAVFQSGRLRAEHGSAYALFNAPDPANHPARLPLGYFISRVAATAVRNTGRIIRHYYGVADDILELLGPGKLAPCVFEAVLEEACLHEDTMIEMPPGAGPSKVRAGDVKARYANLYDQWKEHVGPGLAFKAVMAEIGWLEDLADRLCKKGGTNVVVFGHSHSWALDKDSLFVDERIYANCGAWCDEAKPCTYVQAVKDPEEGKHTISVMEWDRNTKKVNELRHESVKL